MAFARFSKGLRRGSTKTETYSTLATKKYGRVQIIKDRVTDIKNPQTITQMQQRVIFATVTKAAQVMAGLVEIAREKQPDRNFARQEFVTENIEYIRSVAGRRVGSNLHYLAAYAPKGNQQLIPNSYIVSKGSLELPTAQNIDGNTVYPWEVNTSGDGGSFGSGDWSEDNLVGALAFGEYTHEELWRAIFGLQPGDQLTFPQIIASVSSVAQAMYDGEKLVDKTLVTNFAAPRMVLKDEFASGSITIGQDTTIEQIKTALTADIDDTNSYMTVVTNIMASLAIDEIVDGKMALIRNGSFAASFGIVSPNLVRALGVILSRKVNGKWCYSTCQLVCVWEFIGDGNTNYFGFVLDNAIETYLPSAKSDANGNFLQRGGESDIMPPSFS